MMLTSEQRGELALKLLQGLLEHTKCETPADGLDTICYSLQVSASVLAGASSREQAIDALEKLVVYIRECEVFPRVSFSHVSEPKPSHTLQ